MTGLEKIIFDIQQEARTSADSIIQAANKEADEIIEQARVQGKEKSSVLSQQSETDVKDYLSRARSAAELQKRKSILDTKQQIISDVIDKAQQSLYELTDEEYFDMILKMFGKYALPQKGEILFSSKDLKRFPDGFEAKINKAISDNNAELVVSNDTRSIGGGFILVYGGVEENCSFDALFDSIRETLQDKTQEILF